MDGWMSVFSIKKCYHLFLEKVFFNLSLKHDIISYDKITKNAKIRLNGNHREKMTHLWKVMLEKYDLTKTRNHKNERL